MKTKFRVLFLFIFLLFFLSIVLNAGVVGPIKSKKLYVRVKNIEDTISKVELYISCKCSDAKYSEKLSKIDRKSGIEDISILEPEDVESIIKEYLDKDEENANVVYGGHEYKVVKNSFAGFTYEEDNYSISYTSTGYEIKDFSINNHEMDIYVSGLEHCEEVLDFKLRMYTSDGQYKDISLGQNAKRGLGSDYCQSHPIVIKEVDYQSDSILSESGYNKGIVNNLLFFTFFGGFLLIAILGKICIARLMGIHEDKEIFKVNIRTQPFLYFFIWLFYYVLPKLDNGVSSFESIRYGLATGHIQMILRGLFLFYPSINVLCTLTVLFFEIKLYYMYIDNKKIKNFAYTVTFLFALLLYLTLFPTMGYFMR